MDLKTAKIIIIVLVAIIALLLGFFVLPRATVSLF
jgi:hypothetical protein